MQEKLNLVKYSHSTKRQLNQMVYGEHLSEDGTHLATSSHHLSPYMSKYVEHTYQQHSDHSSQIGQQHSDQLPSNIMTIYLSSIKNTYLTTTFQHHDHLPIIHQEHLHVEQHVEHSSTNINNTTTSKTSTFL